LANDVDEITAETLRDHLEAIRKRVGSSTPMWAFEEMAEVARRVESIES
jgi:hypothetical protein